jgi:hypothetical protein
MDRLNGVEKIIFVRKKALRNKEIENRKERS